MNNKFAAALIGVFSSIASPGYADGEYFTGFVDNKDGTVTDPRSGLIWKRCFEGYEFKNGVCNGSATLILGTEAKRVAQQSNFLEKNDWRLPTANEISSVVDQGDKDCSEGSAFSKALIYNNGDKKDFWTSEPPRDDYAGRPHYFKFSNHYCSLIPEADGSINRLSVRLVRSGGQIGGTPSKEFLNEPAANKSQVEKQRQNQEKIQKTEAENKRKRDFLSCDNLYGGKPVSIPIDSKWGRNYYKGVIMGVSQKHGVASAKVTESGHRYGEMVELGCGDF